MSANINQAESQSPENGLPLFEGTSWEDHVSGWFETGQMIQDGLWLRGAIASSLDIKYGDESMERFAGEVMVTARSVRQHRQVYRFYQNGKRFPFLSWFHHLVAMYTPDPVAALTAAEDDGLSARNMAEAFKVKVPATGDELPLLAAAHVSHNSGENEWYTPPQYVKAARAVLGEIDLDPASCKEANKYVLANDFYSAKDDGLSKEWKGRVWMNPPYASDLVGRFTSKLTHHYLKDDIQEAIVLVNNATETSWFQDMAKHAAAISLISPRIKFLSPDGTTGAPLQGQVILYFGANRQAFQQAFEEFGLVVWR